MNQLQMNIELSQSSIQNMEEELQSEFNDQLNEKERVELDLTSSNVTDLSNRLVALSKEKATLESQKTSYEELLSKSLHPKRRKLQRDISSLNSDEVKENIVKLEQDLELSRIELAEFEESIAKAEKSHEDETEALRNLQNELEELKRKENSVREQIRGESNSINKILHNRSILLQKRDKCMKNIRDLGSIPSNALQL
jgi:structural maintenance of chromosome 3 (chondroitin sulfate proteoglycan 6)